LQQVYNRTTTRINIMEKFSGVNDLKYCHKKDEHYVCDLIFLNKTSFYLIIIQTETFKILFQSPQIFKLNIDNDFFYK